MESLAELYRRPGFMIKRLHQVATALFLEECGRYNMTPSQYQALCALREYSGINQGELGRLIGQDRSTVSLVVRLLLERGFIRRLVDARDKRRTILRLSEAGAQALEEAAPAAKKAQNRLLSALPQDQRDGFMHLLYVLLDAHGAHIDAAATISEKSVSAARKARIGARQEARTSPTANPAKRGRMLQAR